MTKLISLFVLMAASLMAWGQIWDFSDLQYMHNGRNVAASPNVPSEWQRLAFRLTATNVPSGGQVASWTDMIQGKVFSQNNASFRPSRGLIPPIDGVYFFRAGTQSLPDGPDSFAWTQTNDAQNDYAVYCIFQPVSTPSGVFYGLWGNDSGSVTIGIHPSMTVNQSSDDIYGTCVVNQINVFVANEGYYNTNRGRWMNNVTNATSVQAYSVASRPFALENVGIIAGGSYYMDGAIYEIGVWTNKIITAADATAIYNYALATFH